MEGKKHRAGFTLVELLVVIIIIAILAGMLILTTAAATDKMEFSAFASDLRTLKGACYVYRIDTDEWPSRTPGGSTSEIEQLRDELSKHLDRDFLLKYRKVYLRSASADPGGTDNLMVGIDIASIASYSGRSIQKLRDYVVERASSLAYFGEDGQPFTASTSGNVVYLKLGNS